MPRRIVFVGITFVEQPLLFIMLVFIAGILTAKEAASATPWLFVASGLWLIAGAAIALRSRLALPLLLAGFYSLGGTILALDEASIGGNRVVSRMERGEVSSEEIVDLRGRIRTAPELAPERIYLDIEVEAINYLGADLPTAGRVQLIIPFNDQDARSQYDALGLSYGDRIRALCQLRRPLGYRNPGSPSFPEMLRQRGLDAIGSMKNPVLIERCGKPARSIVIFWLYSLRSSAIATLLRTIRQPTSGLLVAAVFGNRYFLDQRVAESFRAGGTFHLLVISGLHVALIATALVLCFKNLIRNRLLRFALVIAVIWAFSLMVGAEPAVSRAATMLSFSLTAQLLFRGPAGANVLGAAALALLVWQPYDLFNPAFQLSFLTVVAITLVTGPIYERVRRIGQWQPSEATPYPPRVRGILRCLSETIFWDDRKFQVEMAESHIRFHLEKSLAARWLGRYRLSRLAKAVWASLLTTIGVQIFLLPLMIIYFHRFSIIAPIANVIEAGLVFALMTAGCLFLVIRAIHPVLAVPLVALIDRVGLLVSESSRWFEAAPGASFRVPGFGNASAAVYGGFFVVAAILVLLLSRWNPLAPDVAGTSYFTKRFTRVLAVASSALLAALIVVIVSFPFDPDFEKGRLSVSFLDVGQGDAMAISFPGGTLMMLDSGGKLDFRSTEGQGDTQGVPLFVEDRAGVGELAVSAFLWRHGVKRVDLIAASHSHADHVQGFVDIVRNFQIGDALAGPLDAGEPAFSPFPPSVVGAGISRHTVSRGDAFDIDGVRIEVLAPFTASRNSTASSNDRSLVMRLRYGERRFLLTGDIERQTESFLVEAGDDLRADVLKVAHHGSRTSSSPEFLARTAATLAIVSVASPSPFGHPHTDVIERLRKIKAKILMTSECGAITISTNGRDLRFATHVKCESTKR